MGKRKDDEIRKSIREMMQNNVMRLVISGQGESSDRYHQNRKMFLYLEVCDTKPEIRYLYDLSTAVFLGRSENENQICIRDRMVSRYQGRIWAEDGKIYYADEEGVGNPSKIRRKLWTAKLRPGERIRLKTKDILVVGTVKLRIRLFIGEQELFGYEGEER